MSRDVIKASTFRFNFSYSELTELTDSNVTIKFNGEMDNVVLVYCTKHINSDNV